MVYQFQQLPFKHRFSGIKGWVAFGIGLMVMTLILLMLPLLIIIAAMSFVFFRLFGRRWFKQQIQRQSYFHARADNTPDETNRFDSNGPSFGRSKGYRQGFTFEHNPSD